MQLEGLVADGTQVVLVHHKARRLRCGVAARAVGGRRGVVELHSGPV
ncbi:hypothetical protein [Streptomyces sp. PU-14G]